MRPRRAAGRRSVARALVRRARRLADRVARCARDRIARARAAPVCVSGTRASVFLGRVVVTFRVQTPKAHSANM